MHIGIRVLAGSILGATIIASGGCLAVAAAAGTGLGVAYVKGDLEAVVEATPRKFVAEAEAALESMGIRVLAANANDVEGTVNARTADDKKIMIKVSKQTDATSTVSIRVGTFGDEVMSQAIYEKIKANL